MWSTKSVINLLLAAGAAACLAVGCMPQGDESPVVARVYDHELHQSDLIGIVGEGVSPEDSVAIVDNYIDQWVRQTVMLCKAEKNVEADFSRQMSEYRNSLLTYAYEQQILNQLLDTHVTDERIADYYEQHQDEFQLKNSIVKVVYVTAPKKSAADAKLKKLIAKSTFGDNEVVELEELATRNRLQGYYDADAWMAFHTLQSTVPITTYNEDLFLKQHRSIVLGDDSLAYYVRILDYKVSDDVSPLELQRENIRAIILNHRKIELLVKLQADLMKEAEAGGHVKRNVRNQ